MWELDLHTALCPAGVSRLPRELAHSRAPCPRAVGSLSFPLAGQMDVAMSRTQESRFMGGKCGQEELQPWGTGPALSVETPLYQGRMGAWLPAPSAAFPPPSQDTSPW